MEEPLADADGNAVGEEELHEERKRRLLRESARADLLLRRLSTINPFVHRTPVTLAEALKMCLTSWTLVPLRVLCLAGVVCTTAITAKLALFGTNHQDLLARPLSGWRALVPRFALPLAARLVLYCFGFHYVKTIGKPSPVAPIVVSNHPSMFEPLWLYYVFHASMVGKAELAALPDPFGLLARAVQPIFVARDNPTSRRDTVNDISRRALSYHRAYTAAHPVLNDDQEEDEDEDEDDVQQNHEEEEKGRIEKEQIGIEEEGEADDKVPITAPVWPRVALFPEGTNTNGSCLISFRIGAFIPGLPVQPVVVSYPYAFFDPSAAGISALWLCFRAMCQFHNFMTVTYLPVYYPNRKERRDPKLFARNVRRYMARMMSLPTTEHSYDDVALQIAATKNSKQHFPGAKAVIEVVKMQEELSEYMDLSRETLMKCLAKFMEMDVDASGEISFSEFLEGLSLPNNTVTRRLFARLDVDGNGQLDLREFITGMAMLTGHSDLTEYVQLLHEIGIQ
eukprot:TRINITY_DN7418_c0_g1_i1.p1 TRINITY_DN7418_c0_g1~~TRINITY_DN7418_c0_g1_i1.p1  ORF type:complete len:509 (-),score=81.79 TRINITY_DN7418_c0_g1_i1:15-1541(-)